ncbi:hypothetical protein GIB67_011561 [Kingdonia uniflora]|uniref:Bromo domain-containing protein n=1 Tax=Kingdonia uniflora TaxID=39325 RepID=A0A7J7NM20_9MAGN|nr:hypothetical protein GIB67_011561 [Kingdonia uniflora]
MGKIETTNRRRRLGRPLKSSTDLRRKHKPESDPLRRSTRRRSQTFIEDFYEDDFEDDDVDDVVEDEDEEDDDVARRRDKKRREEKKKKEERNGVSKQMDSSVPGTPSISHSRGIPLPDKKQLELILDKLQKKDAYGVYAEPVDPEELPDYHEIIEKPMDFSTIRKKLASGAYSNLEKLENDVFLLCSNAMQYNAPETIYFKQARSIQELASKKFQRLKKDFECTEAERKLEKNNNSNSLLKKPIHKPSPRKNAVEPICSDFSAGATLATMGDTSALCNTVQVGGYEKLNNGVGTVDGSFWLTETKSEEQFPVTGKGLPSKLGKKPFVIDENRRVMHNIPNQPVGGTDLAFTLFEGENKQLVAVGLHADHSYARSLARFAANLGPVAWKVASRRIEQALPEGLKYGHGWVGEYEPHPTPVLVLESHSLKHSDRNWLNKGELKEDIMVRKGFKDPQIFREYERHPTPAPMLENRSYKDTGRNLQSTLESREDVMASKGFRDLQSITQMGARTVKECHLGEPISEGRPGPMYHQQNPLALNFARSENTEVLRNHAQSFMPPQADDGAANGCFPNGTSVISSLHNPKTGVSPYDFISNQQTRATTPFLRGNNEGLSDPVQLMRMLAEKNKDQQITPLDISSRREDPRTTAALAWMTLGGAPKTQISAASLYNSAREFPQSPVSVASKMQTQSEKNCVPPVVKTDLSRFQIQSPWRGLTPHVQSNNRHDMLPPDLNIGFQSPDSPVKQPPGFMRDSQQPDLALQL